ncbi:mediator of RNA polymerase II transcription subunit 8 [Zygosaccharomyces mellis]|uniref:Mediator of RNA polymerase II transcription subunit 8 n=1 Tax=Zygosaccharomyces mellis TaxID=42258 RepID=A0A4C2EA80_9SACH|nr:mediator of RNA polymerase II transcription subunit 8 [Zygosaccharomyces mellis]
MADPGDALQDTKPNFDDVPAQAVDAVRMRLAQLTHSLRRIRDELSRAELPQWYTLQSQLNVTLSQIMSVTSTLQHFQGLLDSTVVYPLPNFPTTSHEGLLTTLLRKKNIPEVEEQMDAAKDMSELDLNTMENREVEKSLQNDRDISKWCLQTLVSEYRKHDFKSFREDEDTMKITVSNDKKPTKPFKVEDILKYTYRGENANREVNNQETEDVTVIN